MRRRVLTFLAGLSLLLFATTVALWVRSYAAGDSLVWEQSGLIVDIELSRGQIWFRWLGFDTDYPSWSGLSLQSGSPSRFPPLPVHFAGFSYAGTHPYFTQPPAHGVDIQLPCWPIAFLT